MLLKAIKYYKFTFKFIKALMSAIEKTIKMKRYVMFYAFKAARAFFCVLLLSQSAENIIEFLSETRAMV